ncbi:MAG: hypothetical protein QOF68_2506, partial [Gaiellales bacterium]|nr:hypothetical protein [Gaiellales bacterium]
MRQVVLAALVLALILPVSASAAGYSSAGGDLELRASGSTVELVRDGHVVASDTAGADWVIQGADGVADTLTVRNPDGGIIRGHISFDGGDGDGVDTLKLSGGRADTGAGFYAGPDSGSFHYERGTDELTVAYAGLEPIVEDVALANYTINGTAGDDIITIDDGAPGDGRLRVSIAGHEEVNFKNKTNVLIDAGAGSDTFFFINTETAAGLTGDLTANTGTELNESIRVGTANYTGGGLILETTGQIVDLNPANTHNVTGDRLGIQAGFGTLQLDSTVSNLEADLASGTVIRLINSGNVTIGGVSATLHGLRIGGDASGGDGSIDFRNTGDVTLSDATGPETVRSGFGIGGVGISVTGTLSTTAGQDAIRAPTGSVGITAGGYAIAAGSEIVSASETAVQTVSGAFDLGGSGSGPALSDAELDEITASSLRVTGPTIASTAPVSLAPAKVPLLLLVSLGGISQTGSGGISAQSLDLQATSGVVALTSALNDVDSVTGVARSLDFADLDDITIGTTPSNGVESTGPGFVVTRVTAAGDVTVNGRVKSADLAAVLTQGAGHLIDNNNLITGNRARLAADRMTLADGNVLVSTFGNTIAVEGGLGSSPGVNLGSATDAAPNTIELSDAELNTMTGFALRVGTASGGSIAISAPITLDPPKLRGLFLISGGAVTQSASVVAALLRTASAGATTLGSPANDVDSLAGTTSGAGSAFTYNDADGVAVSAVDGQSGVATSDGDVSITTASGGNL